MTAFDLNTPMIERHRNLRTLMHFLEDLPHSKFHMPTWAAKDATATSCGTAGCAAGWAVTLFHKQGLILLQCKDYLGTYSYPTLPTLHGESVPSGCNAFAEFFGLDIFDAHHITSDFCSSIGYLARFNLEYPKDITPQMAAETIRGVLQKVAPEVLTEKYEITPKEALLCPVESH